MSRTENATRNIIWGIFNKFVMLGMPFIFRAILIRVLGAEYLGLGTLFNSILQILNMTELGFGGAVVYSLYKPLAENDIKYVRALMNEYKRIYRIIGAIIASFGLAIMPFLKMLIKSGIPDDINIYVLYLIYLSNTVISYWLFGYKSALIDANQRNDLSTKIQTSCFLIQYCIQMAVLLIYKNYYVYIVWIPLFMILNNISISLTVDKMFPQYKPLGRITKEDSKNLRKLVGGLFIQKVCAATRNSFDSIVISGLIGLVMVTQYGNYFYVITALHGLLDVVLVAIRPVIGNSIATETQEKNYLDFRLFQYLYGWVSNIAILCLICFYQPFISAFFGSELLFDYKIMVLFCVYFFFLTTIDIRTVYDDAAGLWWYGKKIVLAESIANIVLNLVLGYFLGIIGIITATILSIFIVNLVIKSRILYNHYFCNYSIKDYYLTQIKSAIIVVISGTVMVLISRNLRWVTLSDYLFGGFICIVTSILLSTIMYRFDANWRSAIDLIKKIFSQVTGGDAHWL